jgi:hypothetical protein
MKAIVLTYDENTIIAEHMISCYEKVWPDHPFTFRIPYQNSDRCFLSGSREYIKTPRDIKGTVLKLLEDLRNEDWIYWCIDDKYPIKLIISRIKSIYELIEQGAIGNTSGILFCRARRMMDPNYLTDEHFKVGNELLLERKAYHQIWIHQFVHVGVIRHLFASFPDIIEKAEMMDDMKDRLVKPVAHKLHVTATNYAVFGESTFRGVITGNCLKSMTKMGFSIPTWRNVEPESTIIIGEL